MLVNPSDIDTMKRYYHYVYLIILQTLLVSCASVSKEDCLKANWEAFGEVNAKQGQMDLSDSHFAKECEKLGFSPNMQSYQKGINKGLVYYCSNENAYKLGTRNQEYNFELCPDNNSRLLAQEYFTGLIEFHHENRKKTKKKLSKNSEQIEDVLEEIERYINPNDLFMKEKIRKIREILNNQKDYLDEKMMP